MATHIAVPLNTMLADLDESLRRLLVPQLNRHGFDGVQIAFDAPKRDWAAALALPTLNLYLYDLRESTAHRQSDWHTGRQNGRARDIRPPLRLQTSYAVTAWTRAIEDEHRLLSQTLAILYAHPTLPSDMLTGTLANGSQTYPLQARVAQPRSDGKADFWTALGADYKPSLDYEVLLTLESGTAMDRGPDTQAQTLRVFDLAGAHHGGEETHRVGGTVRDKNGRPQPDVWIALPEVGRMACSDGAGNFVLTHLAPGEYECQVRTPQGVAFKTTCAVPGNPIVITVNA